MITIRDGGKSAIGGSSKRAGIETPKADRDGASATGSPFPDAGTVKVVIKESRERTAIEPSKASKKNATSRGSPVTAAGEAVRRPVTAAFASLSDPVQVSWQAMPAAALGWWR
jgi:hypothetical protein